MSAGLSLHQTDRLGAMIACMPISLQAVTAHSGAPLIRVSTVRRRVSDGDDSVREIRISCPDATGLGCDITRMLLDFGLKILSGVLVLLLLLLLLLLLVLLHMCIAWDPASGKLHHVTAHTSLLMMLNFRCIVAGDVSTDGKWCFLIIKVAWHLKPPSIAQHVSEVLIRWCCPAAPAMVPAQNYSVDLCHWFTMSRSG